MTGLDKIDLYERARCYAIFLQSCVLGFNLCLVAMLSFQAKALAEGPATPQAKPTESTSVFDQQAYGDDFSKLPTKITSDTLSLNAKQRIFIYKGNVTVEQGDMRLISKTLEGSYGEDNRIQKLIAKGDVKITKQDIEATGQQALYDALAETMTLSDNPELKQGESILTADKIRVFLRENRSQAEGAVRVTLVKNKDSAAPSFMMLNDKDPSKDKKTTTVAVATPARQ